MVTCAFQVDGNQFLDCSFVFYDQNIERHDFVDYLVQ